MTMMACRNLFTALALQAVMAGAALAQPGGGPEGPPPPNGGPPKPPKAALDACKAKAAEAPCAFKGRKGDEKGVCFAPPNLPLACLPSDAPRPPAGGGAPPRP